MSTDQSHALHSEHLAASPAQDAEHERSAWYPRRPGTRTWPLSPHPSSLPLFCCLVIACVVRAFIVLHTQGFIDGDEALVGIQAQHILHGELPIYFYNQPYMGSLEAYVMAGIFAMVGPSVWALRAEPILLSLVVVCLTWHFASELADTAQIPPHAKQWFMTLATFLAALPPLYDTVLQLRTLGGYVEIFIFMLLLLLFALKLPTRRAAGASQRELAWRWAAIGCIVGLGLWVNPLIVYGIVAEALWLVWDWLKVLNAARRQGELENAEGTHVGARFLPARATPARLALTLVSLRTLLLPALASIPACMVGLTPAIYWGALHHWQNLTYILTVSGSPQLRPEVQAHYPTRLDIFFGLVHLYTACVGPRILGGELPGDPALLGVLHTPTLLVSGLCILATLTLVVLSFVNPHPLLLKVRKLAALPIVFVCSVSSIFCLTQTAASGLWSCQFDFAGRYATPVMLVLPFFVATSVTTVMLVEAKPDGPDAAHVFDGEQTVGGQQHALESRSSSLTTRAWRYQKVALAFLVGSLIFSVYLQVVSYALSDAGSTFQSAFCTRAPVNDDAIIAYLHREHIHYAWANNWIAYPLVFKTQERIIISDPLPIIRNVPMLNRIPAYTEAVRKADRPSFIILVNQGDPHPALLQLLDAEHVTYRVARFPAHEIKDVLVITPLNKTVSPLHDETSLFLRVFYCSRQA
ncbi:MAG TPA: hypothetical protein VGU68_00785 [Ktedonobacteraceae bacterium]|nr:hypothetical protein [Ktedonobacteraceae bacterium]